ncbi:MAG: MoxR family ATPase [Gammaproteobacteria bacterium]|nr:MoxR family ATPase [Gammaproteobacteria bacterium]
MATLPATGQARYTPSMNAHPQQAASALARAQEALDGIIVGKPERVRLALCCLIAGGHLLLEDAPGMGKTTLAHGLGAVLGLEFHRIQFTADLLPADVLGVSIFDPASRQFAFHRGPIFTQLLLADEINRATPKTQSALLEAMAEGQVTVDGTLHLLPKPFFVVATQNPRHQIGTFPLPESQMDRFLMRLDLGFPDRAAERRLLTEDPRQMLLDKQPAILAAADVAQAQEATRAVHVAAPLVDYLQDLLAASRTAPELGGGFSPRAGLGLLMATRAHALLAGRGHAVPEDLQAVAPAVLAHRVEVGDAGQQVRALLERVPVP